MVGAFECVSLSVLCVRAFLCACRVFGRVLPKRDEEGDENDEKSEEKRPQGGNNVVESKLSQVRSGVSWQCVFCCVC